MLGIDLRLQLRFHWPLMVSVSIWGAKSEQHAKMFGVQTLQSGRLQLGKWRRGTPQVEPERTRLTVLSVWRVTSARARRSLRGVAVRAAVSLRVVAPCN